MPIGEWIAINTTTPRKCQVLKLAQLCGISRHEALGIVVEFWTWLASQTQTEDDHVDANVDVIASAIGTQVSYVENLLKVGWLIQNNDGTLQIPNADRWGSAKAKARLKKTRRQTKWRADKKANKQNANVDARVDAQPSTIPSTSVAAQCLQHRLTDAHLIGNNAVGNNAVGHVDGTVDAHVDKKCLQNRLQNHVTQYITSTIKSTSTNVPPYILSPQNSKEEIEGMKARRFSPPTLEEVREYAEKIEFALDAAQFIDYYSARQWRFSGNVPMKDWKAAVRTWKRKDATRGKTVQPVKKEKDYNEGF